MDPNVVGLIIGIIIAAVTIWLILWGARKDSERINAAQQQSVATPVPQKSAAVVSPVIPVVSPVPVASKPDDLTLIEGIGPKIASLLTQKGITTFAQLAATEVPVLEKILKENGLQFAKPGSWPEQSRLAAEGKMDELKTLQDKLVAGR